MNTNIYGVLTPYFVDVAYFTRIILVQLDKLEIIFIMTEMQFENVLLLNLLPCLMDVVIVRDIIGFGA